MLTLLLVVVCLFQAVVIVSLYKKLRNYDGNMVISRQPDGKTIFSLELEEDPNNIYSKDMIIFQVIDETPPEFD